MNATNSIRPSFVATRRWLTPEVRSQIRSRGRVIYVGSFTRAERAVLQKRPPILPSQWAARHRILRVSNYPGPWRNEMTPHLVGIMDAMAHTSIRTVIICKAPQIGGSEAVHNFVGYSIDRSPGPVMYVYPNRNTGIENSQDRIQPMIEDSARLRSYLTGVDDHVTSLRVKLIHMPIHIAWAGSPAQLGNRPIKLVVFDETDKYPPEASKREADPISLGEKRVITFQYNYKILKVSTPTTEEGPIWQALTTKAQEIFDYWVRCPFCGEYERMVFEQIRWPEGERDPERVQGELLAWYECSLCKAHWTDRDRDRAAAKGEWQGRKSGLELFAYLRAYNPRQIGFHLPSWISQFRSLSAVAASFLTTQLKSLPRNVYKKALRDFNNAERAEPWRDYSVERQEDRILALRDERPRGVIPSGGVVSCLTAGVDTQDNGFWYVVRAWGWPKVLEKEKYIALESWKVRGGFIESFAALHEVLFEEIYMDAEDNEYLVRLAIQDAMGHRTSEVYDFVRLRPGRMIAFQGVDTRRMTQPYTWSTLEYYPGTKKLIPGGLRLLRADVNYFKDILAGKLEIALDDPGAFHLHAETTEEYARQMCAEFINEKQVWECPSGQANHLWDCEAMNLVAAEVLRVKFWKRPEEKMGKKVEDHRERPEGWLEHKREGWLKHR